MFFKNSLSNLGPHEINLLDPDPYQDGGFE
jgi:hypothetical protein